MILPSYRIAASSIPGAGKGMFLEQAVAAGSVITAPDDITRTYRHADIAADPALSGQMQAAARWFEDIYTLSPDWPDECYVNHSFHPSGLWHLGFIFAASDLAPGTEVTVDYRHLLPPGEAEGFEDATSGEKIIGFGWKKSLTTSTEALAELLR